MPTKLLINLKKTQEKRAEDKYYGTPGLLILLFFFFAHFERSKRSNAYCLCQKYTVRILAVKFRDAILEIWAAFASCYLARMRSRFSECPFRLVH